MGELTSKLSSGPDSFFADTAVEGCGDRVIWLIGCDHALMTTMPGQRDHCTHDKTNAPTTRPMHPRQDQHTHDKTNACIERVMHPRQERCTHCKTDAPTKNPMHPHKRRCTHDKTNEPHNKTDAPTVAG